MNLVKRIGLMMALVGAAGMFSSGCFVSASPAEPAVATNYYTPLYYNGYVVYYDEVGRPVYYVGGARYYIPPTYVGYNRYISHYRVHRTHYHRWYGHRGHSYRTYRRGHTVHRGGGRRAPARTHHRRRR